MKRNIVLFCFVFASLVFFTDICQAHNPQRIAVLPVMNQSYMHDAEVEKVISDSLYANFHVPLAKILNTYEFVPVNEIEAAFPEIKDRVKMKKIDRVKLQQVASQLNADLVIGGVITDLCETTFTNILGGNKWWEI